MKRSRWWVWLLLVGALVAGAAWFDAQHAKGDREVDVYVLGAQRMVAGDEIYRPRGDAKPFTYPPFAALLFVPITWLPSGWLPAVWFAVNFLVLLAMLRWLHRFATAEVPGRAPPRAVWFWLLTGVFSGHHVHSVFTNQSHDLLIAGAVAMTAAAWCRGRAVAGAWVGLGAAMKATPLLFVGLFGQRLRWGALAIMLLAVAVATLAPDLLFPRADGRSWVVAWYEVNLRALQVGGTADGGAWGAHSVLNQSLSGAMHRWFRPLEAGGQPFTHGENGTVMVAELSVGAVKAITLAWFAVVLAALFATGRCAARALRGLDGDVLRETMRRVALGEVGAFACGMVLLSPQSSKSHFCVWLFPVAFVVEQLLRRGRRDVVLLALFVPAFALGVVSKELVGRANGELLLAWGNVTWSTVLLLLATLRGLWLEARDRKRAAEGGAT
ncbi:MAG: DUF2029 domain-containing protein [Planctomycetes bacterium]|nr:DUF2029 domain-containing protein [Planctomycetota bacterium]